MLLFGHIGITLASAAVGFRLRDKLRHRLTEDEIDGIAPSKGNHPTTARPSSRISFFGSLANRMDIRFLLVGSMLPDIIDKPVGIYLFRETFSSGRIFSHTLFFLVVVTIIGLIILRYSGKTWAVGLSFGTLLHLILDQMWFEPKTLFWPLLGIAFERIEPTYWLSNILEALFSKAEVYIPEIIGLIAFAWFAWGLLHHRVIIGFLKQGKV